MLQRQRRLQRRFLKTKNLKEVAKKPIITPRYTRRHFEELNNNILTFTHSSQKVNELKRGHELKRDEIDQQWTGLIQGIYPADDPKSYELLAQIECPRYNDYWEKRADEKSFYEREHRVEFCAFNRSRRNLTRAQKWNWPGGIIMEDNEKKEFLVPRISLLALEQLNFLDFAKSVLQANPRKTISRFTMQELWVTVVTKIYHFEDTLDKELKIGETKECTQAAYRALAEDYRSAYEVAEARVKAKRVLQEYKKRDREDGASRVEKNDDGEDRVQE